MTTGTAAFLCLGAMLFVFRGSPAQWSAPVLVDSPRDTAGVNSTGIDWSPFITVDEQLMYFTSSLGSPNNDLFVCRWEGDRWGRRQRLAFCQPDLDIDERNPAVNATNDTLYFVSWGGDWDLYWSFRTAPCDSCWGPPQRMPEPINSPAIEFSVWCTPDNQRLLFSSWRVHANGLDIYQCRRDATTETGWSEPELLPGRLNTGSMELYPSMGLSTTELFYYEVGYSALRVSHLTDSGWTAGEALPDSIILGWGLRPPCITPDGRRLYFSTEWRDSALGNSDDIWYTERPLSTPGPPVRRPDKGLRLEIYPNPARDELTIQVPPGVRQLTLYNILGRTVASQGHDGRPTLMLWKLGTEGALTSGTYYLKAWPGTAIRTVPIRIIK